MAQEAEFVRGAGGDPNNPPLPQGAAQEVNEVPIDPVVEEDFVEAEMADPEVEAAAAEPALALLARQGVFSGGGETPGFEPRSPEEQAIFAPENITEEQYLQSIGPRAAPPPPENIGSWLPALAAASRHPHAPPGIRALFEAIIDALYPPGEANA